MSTQTCYCSIALGPIHSVLCFQAHIPHLGTSVECERIMLLSLVQFCEHIWRVRFSLGPVPGTANPERINLGLRTSQPHLQLSLPKYYKEKHLVQDFIASSVTKPRAEITFRICLCCSAGEMQSYRAEGAWGGESSGSEWEDVGLNSVLVGNLPCECRRAITWFTLEGSLAPLFLRCMIKEAESSMLQALDFSIYKVEIIIVTYLPYLTMDFWKQNQEELSGCWGKEEVHSCFDSAPRSECHPAYQPSLLFIPFSSRRSSETL